jgi:hypothetical protein
MKRRLEEQWNTYRAQVMPADAHPTQVIETRRGFFAGAAAFFGIQNAAYDGSTPEPTAEDLQVITDLGQELLDFAEKIQAGVA